MLKKKTNTQQNMAVNLNIVICTTLLLVRTLTAAMQACYTCTSTEESSLCEKNPVTLIHAVLQFCPRDVCTIVRVENWPSQKVKSFYRGCDSRTKVFERNNCQIEKDERTCFTACVGDLCNFGDGLDDVKSAAAASQEFQVWILWIVVTFSLML